MDTSYIEGLIQLLLSCLRIIPILFACNGHRVVVDFIAVVARSLIVLEYWRVCVLYTYIDRVPRHCETLYSRRALMSGASLIEIIRSLSY